MAAVIFDFDGTIGDSFNVIVSIFYALTKQNKLIDNEFIQHLRQEPPLIVARRLGIKPWQIPFLLFRGRHMMSQRMNEVKLFPGMNKTIEQLHNEGHELFILSSNSSHNVYIFLKKHHLDQYFVSVKGSIGIFGKTRALKQLLIHQRLDRRNSWFVGDEMRDIEAAKSNAINNIAVTWGFAEPTTFEALLPTAVAHHPKDIVKIINSE